MISKTVPQVKKRPRGITIIALYNCLLGICTIFPAIIIILEKVSGVKISFNTTIALWGLWGFVNILLFWGLWKKRPWAIWSTISAQLVVLSYLWFWGPQGAFSVVDGRMDYSIVVYSIIPIIILFYLSFIWEKKPSNLYP